MTRIALVVSDVDGTLLTKDKILTDGAKAAVRKLHDAGIGFTIVSSRPTIGMGFLIEPLEITLPVGAFNGSSIVDAKLKPIEQHLIAPDVAQRSLDVLDAFGVDIWLFSNERWYTRNPQRRVRPAREAGDQGRPHHHRGFHPASGGSLQDRRRQFGLRAAEALRSGDEGSGRAREATAVRSQNYYLDVTPPGHDKGTFVADMSKRLGIPTEAVATIGDMENDLPMFARSGVSFAMGNAADAIKQQATHVTDSNERDGFAAAMETVLKLA